MGEGTKTFLKSADGFLEKAAKMLDTAIQNESLKIEDAKEYADLIHKVMQSVKLMEEKKDPNNPKDKKDESIHL